MWSQKNITMKSRNSILKYIILLVCSFLTVSEAFAAGMGMGGGPCGGIFPPCPIPLDSGEILLLVAGAIFGAYKIYCSLKKNPA